MFFKGKISFFLINIISCRLTILIYFKNMKMVIKQLK